jgi:hypothetical protein
MGLELEHPAVSTIIRMRAARGRAKSAIEDVEEQLSLIEVPTALSLTAEHIERLLAAARLIRDDP